jgi:hypothetical protein
LVDEYELTQKEAVRRALEMVKRNPSLLEGMASVDGKEEV